MVMTALIMSVSHSGSKAGFLRNTFVTTADDDTCGCEITHAPRDRGGKFSLSLDASCCSNLPRSDHAAVNWVVLFIATDSTASAGRNSFDMTSVIVHTAKRDGPCLLLVLHLRLLMAVAVSLPCSTRFSYAAIVACQRLNAYGIAPAQS
jgi:hypothetical protein